MKLVCVDFCQPPLLLALPEFCVNFWDIIDFLGWAWGASWSGVTSVPNNVPVALFTLFAFELRMSSRCWNASPDSVTYWSSPTIRDLVGGRLWSTLKVKPIWTLTLNKSCHMTRQRLATVNHSKTRRLNDAEAAAWWWTSLNHFEAVWTSWCCLDQYGPVGTQLKQFNPVGTNWNPIKTRLNQLEPV